MRRSRKPLSVARRIEGSNPSPSVSSRRTTLPEREFGDPGRRLHVCVCGWHYWPAFYESLLAVRDRHGVTVVANRSGDTRGLPTIARENTGLDWGAFSHFLARAWDGEADVLFLHDDVVVEARFWSDVLAIQHDQAFIFRDRSEYDRAYSHGRAHFGSSRFLRLVCEAGGIWFDQGNRGFIASGTSWSEEPPPGSMDHNAGVRAYTHLVERLGAAHPRLSVNRPVYSQHVVLGVRGEVAP